MCIWQILFLHQKRNIEDGSIWSDGQQALDIHTMHKSIIFHKMQHLLSIQGMKLEYKSVIVKEWGIVT